MQFPKLQEKVLNAPQCSNTANFLRLRTSIKPNNFWRWNSKTTNPVFRSWRLFSNEPLWTQVPGEWREGVVMLQLKRRNVTSRSHGSKISRSQQSFLTRRLLSLSNDGRKSWATVLFLSAIMHRKVIHRAVTKISSYQVNTTSRRGIEPARDFFWFYFSSIVLWK